MLQRLRREGNPPTLFVEIEIDTATMENSIAVPWKTKGKATIWPCNSTPAYISRGKENMIQKDTCTLVFIAALFTTVKTWK